MIQQPQSQLQNQTQQPQSNNTQEHINSSFPNPIATTSNQVIINFSDGRQVSYAFNQLSEITPSLFSHFNPDEQLYLPSWITAEDLSSFCSIYEKGIEYVTDFMDKTKLLKMSEYFENDNFTFSLISDVIIPRLSIENSLNYLLISYNKLKTASQCGGEVDNIWFDFFIKCLEIVGKNLSYYFKKGKTSDIAILDTKILDELYEKFSSFLISNNYLLTDDISLDTLRGSAILISNLEMMIEFLMKYRSQKNFFDLLTNEYMTICGEDNIDELNSLPNPTFLLKINTNEIDSYYEEYKIDISMNMKQIVFIVFYRKSDDSFNVAFKLIENNTVYGSNGSGNGNNVSNNNNNNSNNPRNNGGSFKIITFLSSVVIEEFSNRQINVKSISNNKSMHTIYKINNTRNLINASYSGVNNNVNGNNACGSESNYITLKIYLKPCFIHSMLTSFLLFNFGNLYNEVNISKISKQLLVLILKNKNFNVVNEDKIVMALLNWLDDEINIKEDILEIVEYIKWENVSLSLFFEFIVKYGKNIASEDIEHIFIQAFENKTMSEFQNGVKVIDVDEQKVGFVLRSYSRKVVEELIKATKKLAYSDIFSENKKLNKLSKFNASMLGVKDECSRGSGNVNNINNNNNNITCINKVHSNDNNNNNNNVNDNITNTNGNNKEQSKVQSILSHDVSVNKSIDSGGGLINNNNNNTITNSNKKSLVKHNTAARIHPIASKKSTCKSLNKVSSHNNIITNSVQVNHTRSNKKIKELKHNKSFVNFSINTNNYTTALNNSTSINKNIIRGNSSKQLFTITNNSNVMKTVPNNRRRFIDRNMNNSNSNMLMKSSNGNANRSFMHFHNNSSLNGTRSNVIGNNSGCNNNNNNNKSKPKTMGLITQMSLLNLKYKRKGSSKKFKPFKIS